MDRRSALTASATALAALPTALLAAGGPTLEIGVLPNVSARVLLAQYAPLREYLTRELGRAVQVSTGPTWASFHQRTLGGDYDLIVTAANLARLAQLDGGHVPLLSYLPSIRALLVCTTQRPIRQPSELAGQTLVLSNPQSLVALRGMRWLAENGLQRDRDFKTIGTRTDDSVGSVLVRGEATAGMISGGEFRAIPDALRTQLQVVTTFAEVPGFVLLAHPKVPEAEQKSCKSQLMAFATGSEEGRAFFAQTGFSGFQDVAPGLMESLDTYVETTRRLLAAGS